MIEPYTPNLSRVTESYVAGRQVLSALEDGFARSQSARAEFNRWLGQWAHGVRQEALEDAIEIIEDARAEGETDLRQVRDRIAYMDSDA